MYERLNGKKDGFIRTNSICPTPEAVLLELVQKNDRENIIRLIENNTSLLNHIYHPEYNKPILLIACSEENIEAETVKTLIDLGADIHYSSDIDEEWEAIHFAACSTKSDILKVIVQNLRNPGDINALAKGNTALHILIKHGRSDLTEEFIECAKILVQEGIDVNLGDSNCVSPILWAAKRGYKDIIKVILEKSIVPVDIDSHQSRKKTARDIILTEKLYDGPLPERIDNNNENDENILLKYLYSENENAFVNFKNGDIFNLVNADNTSSTLLQISCDKRLKRAVAHLIDKGTDPNLTTEKNRQTPIEIAAENGYYEIFEILLDHPKILLPKTILITLLKYIDNEQFPGINHAKCYDILLKKLESNKNFLDINEADESQNSPLHYAIRYAESDKVEELLQLGASLGCKNKYDVMPIQDIEPELLKKHLDSCIQFDLKGKKFDKEDFTVTFNYRTLIPPSKKVEYNVGFETSDPETNFNHIITQELVAETEVISYMSKAPEFMHLLKHPVITSFLFMKWHRIRWLFYINLAFYITFFLSLVVYIFTSYANFNSEKSTFEQIIIDVSWLILLATFFILVFRELFQIAVSPEKYFKNFENYIEIILISFAGSILFINHPSEDTKRILSSVSILLAAFELVLMVGQHPQLSTNVVMLKTVSLNFFKFLTWYSLLIIAFALSFYILFSENEANLGNEVSSENSPSTPKNTTLVSELMVTGGLNASSTKNSNKNETAPLNIAEEDKEEDFFKDPGKSLFKTIIMLTGEFDAGSMNFHHFPFTSSIIFSLFIFMIAIILLNLLNGLAVSDTQMIKNNAELVGHIARAQHIRYVESMILGNILPSKLLKSLSSFCCCFPISNNCSFPKTNPLSHRVCLFPHYLNYELTVYPNKGGQICLPLPGKKKWSLGKDCTCSCLYICLDKETIKRTNCIVQEKREQLKIKQEVGYLQKIENIIKTLEKNASSDKMELFLLNKKLDNIMKYLSRECDS
ncbi:hypothetical protein NQ314_020537 [Rhamnusium bicolor]|uniref:Ion transport domain-containing protein n=1 Tax=Rhamnusium bicolor TaxID=1586634 RepID=A0AAV8WLF8_9CUCU|nr:hypothetical protein NQ314_020537 [Rhamnusium bicolor]